jgi:hypothetical protein
VTKTALQQDPEQAAAAAAAAATAADAHVCRMWNAI